MKFITEEPNLFVEIIEAPKESQKQEGYYSASKDKARICKRAVIKSTYDSDKYPVGSTWMIGEAPPMTLNYFGTIITLIHDTNLIAKIDG